jgi:uncharacterized protein YndB with AHSA1/START domain
MSKLKMWTEGDLYVLAERRFAAPPDAVYRAHTEPVLLKQWLLGPEGWSMPVCVCDPRPGGSFRYEWTHPKKPAFHIAGEFVEIEPNRRIVHIERMFLPDPTPDNRVETRFTPDGTGTLMTMRMTLPDAKTRDMMLRSGMEHGMEASYVRLDSLAQPNLAGV